MRAMTSWTLPLATLLATSALAVGCQKKPDNTAKSSSASSPAGLPAQNQTELNAVLAKVDDVTITLGDFQTQLNRQSPYIRARYTSLEQKKEFLDNLIKFEVLAKEAVHRGFDKDPEVVRTMKQVMIQKLMKDEFETKVTPDSISDDELKKYYDANSGDYLKPEEVRVSAIIVKSKGQADRVAVDAKGDNGRTNKGFRDLVTKYSVDEETKLRGGDLRYFAKDSTELPKAVVAAGFALPLVGDVSGVVDGGNGTFYILKQTGRRKAMAKSFDDAKAAIRNKLYRDKRIAAQAAFLANLKSQSKITIDEGNLAKVRVDTSTVPAPGSDPLHHEAPTPTMPAPGTLEPASENPSGPTP